MFLVLLSQGLLCAMVVVMVVVLHGGIMRRKGQAYSV